jgi:hypothetical protein
MFSVLETTYSTLEVKQTAGKGKKEACKRMLVFWCRLSDYNIRSIDCRFGFIPITYIDITIIIHHYIYLSEISYASDGATTLYFNHINLQ